MADDSDHLSAFGSACFAAALLGSFSLVSVGGGHGVLPIGLFMVLGGQPITATLGMAFVGASIFASTRRQYAAILGPGIAMLLISLALLPDYWPGEVFTASAAPFVLVVVVVTIRMMLRSAPPTAPLDEVGTLAIRSVIAGRTTEPIMWIEGKAEDRVRVKTGTVSEVGGGQGHYYTVERGDECWTIVEAEEWKL